EMWAFWLKKSNMSPIRTKPNGRHVRFFAAILTFCRYCFRPFPGGANLPQPGFVLKDGFA
ncbi:MAG: hypothetical protein ABGW78_08485, partial [Pirellulales bacterium]